MDLQARRLAAVLIPLLLGACGSGQQHTTRLLDQRLQARLAPDIAAGKAALQPLPDGDRVTLLDTSMFPYLVKPRSDQNPDVRASVIEGLLDPSLMHVQVTDTSALPDDQRATRIRNVEQYFVANGLASTLQPAPPQQAMPAGPPAGAPAGLTITINLQCPDRHGGAGYGSGKSMPICD